MTEDIFRVATVDDAPEFLELLSSAFQSVKELGIDWPSTNADLAMVTENIVNSSAFVLERNGKLISTITVRFPWRAAHHLLNIHLFGGLQRHRNLQDRGLAINY